MSLHKILLFVFIFFTSAIFNCGYAQQKKSFSYYSDETLDLLKASNEQRSTIKAIKQETDQRIRKTRRDDSLSENEKKEQFKIIYGEGARRYNALLTVEQQAIISSALREIQDYNQRTGVEPKIDSTTYLSNHYKKRMELFSSSPRVSKGIVFLGSSSAERGKWQELFSENKVVNRGIGGDNTIGVLARLDEVISLEPTHVVIFIGTNDIASRAWPVDFVYKKYVEIVDQIQGKLPTCKVVIVSLPINENLVKAVRFKGKSSYLSLLNQKLNMFSVERNIGFIDLFYNALGEDGQLKSQYTDDGIHLTVDGYQVLVDYIKDKKVI